MVKLPYCIVLAALASLQAGCDKQRPIQSYRIPKDPSPMGTSIPGMGAGAMGGSELNQPMASTGMPTVTGEAPANWTPKPLSSMRQASFTVTGENGASADISLIILRGQAGGTLENINRWRQQLALPPISADDLPKQSLTIASPLGALTAVDLDGQPQDGGPQNDGRIIAALGERDGDEWFFKMRGNPALVAANRDSFLKWAASVRKSDAPAQSTTPATDPSTAPPADPSGSMPAGHPPLPGGTTLPAGHPPMPGGASLPAGHPSIPGASPTAPAASPAMPQASGLPAVHDAKVQWEVPANWTSVPAAQMRYASFTVTNPAGEKADVSVIALPGSGGDDLANVNRWRQQVGQAAIESNALPAEITTIQAKNSTISMVRCSGPQTHMLAAWLHRDSICWFFKFSGPASLVDQEKDRFLKFLQSIQFPQG